MPAHLVHIKKLYETAFKKTIGKKKKNKEPNINLKTHLTDIFVFTFVAFKNPTGNLDGINGKLYDFILT